MGILDFFAKKEEIAPLEIAPPDKKHSNPSFSEIGGSGLDRWGMDIFEEFLPNLRGAKAIKTYKEMSSNDAVITSILLASRQLIRGVTWSVEPASTSKADMEAAQFLESCMNDMSTTWSDLIDEITTYFEYGWAYHEIVYKRRMGPGKDPTKRSKYNDGRIGWRKIPGRSQSSWEGWVFDDQDDGSIKGMYQATSKGKAFIPIEKALLFRTTSARGNPEGKSFLRGAYRSWYFKKHIEEIEGIGIERDLAGLPVVKVPEGVDIWDTSNEYNRKAKTAAESLVRSVRRDKNEGIVLPYGWEFDLISSSGSRQFDTNATINRYDQRIAITLLADIVMLGADKVGSFALAEVKKGLLAAALDAQVAGSADVFNRHAVPRLFALNAFPGITDYPKLKASPVIVPDLKTLASYITALSGSDMPLFPNINLENHLRGLANLPLTSEDDEERKKTIEVNREAKRKPKEAPAGKEPPNKAKPDKPTKEDKSAQD